MGLPADRQKKGRRRAACIFLGGGGSARAAQVLDVQDPRTRPILCHPYTEPYRHWELDARGRATATINTGRRPSSPSLTVVPGTTRAEADTDQTHGRINCIRLRVSEWRNGGWPGATSASKTLLAHWYDTTVPRLYWAQIEALETLIWLAEVAPHANTNKDILNEIDGFNTKYCDSLPRLASKMGTGTGKTTVMGMIIAWQACNASIDPVKYASQFVVMSPSTIIRERLAQLDPAVPQNVYDRMSLVPLTMRSRVGAATVEVRTYHAFQTNNALSLLKATSIEKSVLARNFDGAPTESVSDMLKRVLNNRINFSIPLVVINDEGHHCYKPGTARVRRENAKDRTKAALWFKALMGMLSESGRSNMLCIYDLSATPRFIERGETRTDSLFPWTVSDFPLTDAIESGMVKIPRVPLGREGVDVNACRNIYENTPESARRLDADGLPEQVEAPLRALYDDYKGVSDAWAKAGWDIPPVFVIVANTIDNAKELARYVAGSDRNGTWTDGKFDLFSNRPGDPLRTLLVHSDLGEADLTVAEMRHMGIVAEAGRLGRPNADVQTGLETLREALDTIGQRGRIGAHIRCVVSVSMLTEGWDAKNVTHIFGFRRFGTQLICEQVAGRALRRPDTEATGWHQVPSYAEIFGVPFDYLLDATPEAEGPVAPGQSVTSNAVIDPHLAIKFPLVEKYHWLRTSSVKVALDSNKICAFELVEEELTGEAGASKPIGMRSCPDMDSATWFLAAETVKKLAEGANVDRGELFCKMVPIVVDWIAKAIKRDDYDPRWLCAMPNRTRITDAVILACDITSSDGSGHMDPKPDVTKEDTTTGRDYTTTVPDHDYVYDSPIRCSHTSAPCHSKLEARVARVLDGLSTVEAWMRNHPKIGWAIPYYYDGRWKQYQPDFIVRLNTQGMVISCIVEVKGVEDDESRSKAHFAKNVWVKAVNAEGDYGKWAFVQVGAETEVRRALAKIISNEVVR